jgi:hypothetical protein
MGRFCRPRAPDRRKPTVLHSHLKSGIMLSISAPDGRRALGSNNSKGSWPAYRKRAGSVHPIHQAGYTIVDQQVRVAPEASVPFEPRGSIRGSILFDSQEEHCGSTENAWVGDGSWCRGRRHAGCRGSRRLWIQGLPLGLGSQHRWDCRPIGIYVSNPRLCPLSWHLRPWLRLFAAFDLSLPTRSQPAFEH